VPRLRGPRARGGERELPGDLQRRHRDAQWRPKLARPRGGRRPRALRSQAPGPQPGRAGPPPE
jgi:hypothetical protein